MNRLVSEYFYKIITYFFKPVALIEFTKRINLNYPENENAIIINGAWKH